MKKIRFLFFLALLLMTAVVAKADGLVVTNNDIGKVICTDGSVYATEAAAMSDNKIPVAMIAYIDTENHSGLAIALENAANDYISWTNAESTIENWVTQGNPNGSYSVAGATWKLPTTQEWQKMLIGCGADYSPTNDTFSFTEINSKLFNAAQYSELYGSYWSADSNSDYAETAYFNYSESTVNFYTMSKDEQYVNVRACLAFTVDESASTSGIVVTTNDLGKVLCSDGSLYATVTAATEASKTPVAMIAYIDTQNGTGLAIALNDETSTMAWERATLATMAHKPVVTGGTWKLPTVMEWKQMLIGCGATEEIDKNLISYSQMDAKLTIAEGGTLTTGNDCNYWSATVETGEYGQFATAPEFENGQANFNTASSLGADYNVRACLSFTLGESSSTNGIVVTTADVGKVLCTDGSIYATVTAAQNDSKTPAAMITYVNTDSKQGIAIALADESDGTWGWSYSSQMAAEHTPAVSGCIWKMPTVLEWQQMLIGCGATGTADGSVESDKSISYSEMDAKLATAEGTTLTTTSYYWTATEGSDPEDAHILWFDSNSVAYFYSTLYKGNSSNVRARACLTFDIADAPEPELLSLNVTTAHVGKVVCTDGSIYDSVAEAEADDKTPAGMIAFVDMEYETGLVIALQDESEYNEQYNNYDHNYNWSAASAAAGAHTPAVPGATWKLPTIDEWRNMLVGCGATIEYENDNTTTYADINYKLSNAGASTLDVASEYQGNWYGGQYWSSTVKENEYNNQVAQYAEFKENVANLSGSAGVEWSKYVRACFTFNVTLTKYAVTIDDYYASYVTSNMDEAAEGQTVGLTISNIPEGKYVRYVSVIKTGDYNVSVSTQRSNYDDNVFNFTMPDYPVTVDYVGIEDIQSAQVIDGIYYTLDNVNRTAEVTSHPTNGYTGAITVPATVTYNYRDYDVTSIGRDAFYNTTLTSLTLNEGLTTIKQYAFRNANFPIAIPSTVSDISTWAFKGYKGTSMSVAAGNGKYDSRGGCNAIIETAENTLVAGCSATTIPATVTMIGEAAFDGVGLTSITIPANVTTLDMGAFANNPLTAINIPATVTEIYNNPLYGCSELETITVADGNPNYDSRDNCNAICDKEKRWVIATCKNTVIPQTITGIGTFTFAYRQDLNEFKVPKHIGIINDNAFAYSNLWNITMADNNNLIIGRWAFGQCKQLRTVKMGRGISRIDEQVFMGCSNLSNIYVNAPLIPKVKNITFEVDDNGNFTTAKVHVPSASLKTYQKANFWKELNLVGSNSVQGVTATFESVNDTKCSAAGEGSELITEEGTIWDCSASSATITTHGGETCLQVSSSPVTLSDCSTNGFIITDSVKRIVVRAANVTDITCEIVDISENPYASLNQTQSVTGLTASDAFQDFALNFDDSKKYSKAKVNVTITGTSPIYVQSISIVQGGGDYVITDESSTTVQGIEYSNNMSAPANAQDYEAIIDNVPVYVYTTCLPTAPVRDTGLKFYTLSSSTNTSLQFAEVTGALQANTPYLVAVSQDAEIGMSVENESVTLKKESDNYSLSSDGAYKFVGTTTGLTNAEAVAASAYILQDGNVWGQVTAENFEAYIPPFRAYIVPTGPSSRSMLSGGFTDATGIKTLQLTDRDGTKHYFDLNGRRISSPAASGVYVTNGKKVIIKK